jgi:hypothetical protein
MFLPVMWLFSIFRVLIWFVYTLIPEGHISKWFHIYSLVAQFHFLVIRKTTGFISCWDYLNVNRPNTQQEGSTANVIKGLILHGVSFLSFFLGSIWVWTQELTLLGWCSWHPSHSSSSFFDVIFWDRVSWSICLGWLRITILLFSAFQLARITLGRYWHPVSHGIF